MFFNFIENNKLEKYITYHGIVSGDKKRKLLKECNIFILLTRYPSEGQPISILEAMGNGLLVVTTDNVGIPDIIKDGVNGIIIGKKDNIYKSKNKIAQYTLEKLKKVLNGGKATEMIDCAYKQIQFLYKKENYINNIYNIFKVEGRRAKYRLIYFLLNIFIKIIDLPNKTFSIAKIMYLRESVMDL